MSEILDFRSFLKKNVPEFTHDKSNHKIITDLDLWARRDPKFNGLPQTPGGPRTNWHIKRGITLMGPVGVGKDEIMRNLRLYLLYLRSPLVFSSAVVWKFASEYSKTTVGPMAFDREIFGNKYYEELCLTDENDILTGKQGLFGNKNEEKRIRVPTREIAQFYGNKVLVGAELIRIRYDVWKIDGTISLFSTNENEDMIEDVYGTRTYSRLREMTNIMFYDGPNRRLTVDPVFIKGDRNDPQPPAPRDTRIDEHESNYRTVNEGYAHYLATGLASENIFLEFLHLRSYGIISPTEDELQAIMDEEAVRFIPAEESRRKLTASQEEKHRGTIWDAARRRIVLQYYEKLKRAGKEKAIDEVSFNFDEYLHQQGKHSKRHGQTTAGEVLASATGLQQSATETPNPAESTDPDGPRAPTRT